MKRREVVPRDASTVLLLRHGARSLEVFMVVRHPHIEFASGALVYPGGAVDEADRDAFLVQRADSQAHELDARELSWRLAAIREVYEEAGVLLARERGATVMVDAARLADIESRHHEDRKRHRIDLGRLAEQEDLELACDALMPFAHWITPLDRPKRFDTRFYLAELPAGHRACHDGHEAVESMWGEPAILCQEADAGRWNLRVPTRLTLEKLAKTKSVEEALAHRGGDSIEPILAHSEPTREGNRVRIPPEAGYGVTEIVVDDNGSIISRR